MCGIGGAVGSEMPQRELKRTIEEVCQTLRHRGPDDQGDFIGPEIALGHTRLAIRDLELGRQPMTKHGVSIVFNGEIYNAEALRSKMGSGACQTSAEAEVLLEGYIRYGIDLFKTLAGMFAFAIWDAPKQTLFLVRDPWGEKPLYYAKTPHGLAFASEIAALKPWQHLKWEVSLPDIVAFLGSSYVPAPHSGWKGILKLKPGHYLKWHKGTFETKRYHYPKLDEKEQDPSTLKACLEASVAQCAVSDKPIGAFLSGGLDSSAIVTFLKRSVPAFPVYSIDWEDQRYSEKRYQGVLCHALGLKHHPIICDEAFMVQHFDAIVSFYGEPFADESMIPTACLAKRAKEDVDVVLTGDGADEFFHGYERYFFNRQKENYGDVFSAMNAKTRGLVLAKEVEKTIVPTPHLNFVEEWKVGQVNPMRARSLDDIQNYLPDNILTKVDRATMRVSLEARAPFLMPEMTRLALTTGIKQLAGRGDRGKWILKKALEGVLPPLIVNRKKQGFGVPLDNWLCHRLKGWARDRLLSGTLTQSGLFSPSGLEKICKTPQHTSRAIFNLLVLESWWRQAAH